MAAKCIKFNAVDYSLRPLRFCRNEIGPQEELISCLKVKSSTHRIFYTAHDNQLLFERFVTPTTPSGAAIAATPSISASAGRRMIPAAPPQ